MLKSVGENNKKEVGEKIQQPAKRIKKE